MHKRFILLLSVFLGSRVLTAAQTPAPELVPAQELIALIATAAPAPLLAVSFLLPENPGKPAAHFPYLFAGAYERDQGLEGLASRSKMPDKSLIRQFGKLRCARATAFRWNRGYFAPRKASRQ
jgi:hypothetical protein